MDERQRIFTTLKLDINLARANDDALAELARKAALKDFQKGSFIFRAGDPSEHVHLLEKGRVILSKEAPSGR